MSRLRNGTGIATNDSTIRRLAVEVSLVGKEDEPFLRAELNNCKSFWERVSHANKTSILQSTKELASCLADICRFQEPIVDQGLSQSLVALVDLLDAMPGQSAAIWYFLLAKFEGLSDGVRDKHLSMSAISMFLSTQDDIPPRMRFHLEIIGATTDSRNAIERFYDSIVNPDHSAASPLLLPSNITGKKGRVDVAPIKESLTQFGEIEKQIGQFDSQLGDRAEINFHRGSLRLSWAMAIRDLVIADPDEIQNAIDRGIKELKSAYEDIVESPNKAFAVVVAARLATGFLMNGDEGNHKQFREEAGKITEEMGESYVLDLLASQDRVADSISNRSVRTFPVWSDEEINVKVKQFGDMNSFDDLQRKSLADDMRKMKYFQNERNTYCRFLEPE